MWCFQCGAAYEAGVVACVECGVGLVDAPPIAPEEVGEEGDEQIAYEFHDWSFESRRMLDQLLTGHKIAHAWQGATMIVRVADEATVDGLVDEVEVAALPTLDAGRPPRLVSVDATGLRHAVEGLCHENAGRADPGRSLGLPVSS